MAKASKGAAWERDFARELSLWWTGGERDDVFWRTSNSGGRATARRKASKSTFGQQGDIGATCPSGLPFLQAFTIELKRGYSKDTPFSLLDQKDRGAVQTYEEWIEKIVKSAYEAGSFHWLLITKRDQRDAIAFFPMRLFDSGVIPSLRLSGFPYIILTFETRNFMERRVAAMKWNDWKRWISPELILLLNRKETT